MLKRIIELPVLLLLIAGLLCSVPGFAEESSHERTEHVEEVMLLVSEKELQVVSIGDSHYFSPPDTGKTVTSGSSKGFRSFGKLFILYLSLRLYD